MIEGECILQDGNIRSIFRGNIIKAIGALQAAGTWNILDDDRRVSRQKSSIIPCEQPRIGVIAAARSRANADDHICLAIKLCDIVCMRFAGDKQPDEREKYLRKGQAWDQRTACFIILHVRALLIVSP